MISLHQLLKATVKQSASDLHLVSGSPPVLRVDGKMARVKTRDLTSDEIQTLCYSILTDAQKAAFENNRDIDFSFGIKNLARFRVNMFYQRGVVSGVFRRIPLDIPDVDQLGLPSGVSKFIGYQNGLVLVTGPTGSGKTTTLAAIIDKINRDRRGHIMTLEDPIEYVHQHKSCIVNQREVGVDTNSYSAALKYLLRQDPDICLLGELRDREAISAALSIAETGHLVFATLHTNNSVSSINRIISAFPSDHQNQVRSQLSMVLNAILSQKLVTSRQGGVLASSELLVMTPSVRNLIRENKIHQIYGAMQIGQDQTGMITANQSLLNLILKRKIDVKVAFEASPDPDELDVMMQKAGI